MFGPIKGGPGQEDDRGPDLEVRRAFGAANEPRGFVLIVPLPSPWLTIVSAKVAVDALSSNVAMQDLSASPSRKPSMQSPSPLQPTKIEPAQALVEDRWIDLDPTLGTFGATHIAFNTTALNDDASAMLATANVAAMIRRMRIKVLETEP